MQHSLRHYIVILILFTLSFGVGGKMYLCLSPHGDVHIAQQHSSCALVTNHPAPDTTVAFNHHRVKCQSHCLDIALGEDKSDLPNKYTVQIPFPALMPLALSIIPPIAVQQPFYPTPLVQLPQLALRQSVILLI
jgi:hypothetical protein